MGKNYKILLVDDEREEREGIEFLLQRYGYPLSISQAPNGVKALELMEKAQPDILFSDVRMPQMNGLELAKEVNKRWPEVKIIIFSAYGEFSYAKQALEANAVNYLLKPIEIDEFCKVMDQLILDIQEEEKRQLEREQEKWQNRQNVFYKFLTGAFVLERERKKIQNELFVGSRGCRLIHVEFTGDFFIRNEERFRNLVTMYLGKETEYLNLYPDEACLILNEKKYMDAALLETQMKKLLRDVRKFTDYNDGIALIVGKETTQMEELEAEVDTIQSVRREIFGFGEKIFWTEKLYRQEIYSGNIEDIRKQLLQAIENNQTSLIREMTDDLVETIIKNDRISKIYVQNIFYSIVQALYEKNPNIQSEVVLESADILFYSKNAKEMVTLFQKKIYEMADRISMDVEDEKSVISRVRKIAETEYMNNIGLNEIAERVNLAPAYVSYMFKKETGITLIKFLTEIKMEKARMLLEEGKLKINQIAEACGYENQSYFNRIFKNCYGMTPKQFKEGQSV